MTPIFLFDYIESDFLALHIDRERHFGMVLNRHNSIIYFEYDPDVEDWQKRTGGEYGKKSALYTNFLKRDIDIISWHFDYEDGSFLFISEDYRIFLIEL